jgi:hypothetical protein
VSALYPWYDLEGLLVVESIELGNTESQESTLLLTRSDTIVALPLDARAMRSSSIAFAKGRVQLALDLSFRSFTLL